MKSPDLFKILQVNSIFEKYCTYLERALIFDCTSFLKVMTFSSKHIRSYYSWIHICIHMCGELVNVVQKKLFFKSHYEFKEILTKIASVNIYKAFLIPILVLDNLIL